MKSIHFRIYLVYLYRGTQGPKNILSPEDHQIQNEKLRMIDDVRRQLHILILISPLSYPLHMFYSPGSLDQASQMRNGA